ncbi:MAG: hypothetical protein K6A90_05410 [Lachnospiraceae bacterium]|nr:hypothetical protein [Lachnospiraceae bacterium]
MLNMEATLQNTDYEEDVLFAALDKGIDDMEAGRLTPRDEAVKIMKQRLRDYVEVHNSGN